MGFVVNVGPAGTVAGYEMQIIDPQEETVYVFGLDQALRDTFVDQLRSLPDEGTIPGGDNGSAA
jgi:hypothetical protein